MKLSARLLGLDALSRRLAKTGDAVAATALEAASDALAEELDRARAAEDLHAPLLRGAGSSHRFVGADDVDSIGRELGTLAQAPAPWLAPALPAARRPMRAAVRRAAARALSNLK